MSIKALGYVVVETAKPDEWDRFLTEFVRETPKAYGGLSAYQIMSVAMIVAGGVALVARTIRQPAAWQRWRAAGDPT